jgi:hypothetical protein
MNRISLLAAVSAAALITACSAKDAAKTDSATAQPAGAPAAASLASYDPATRVATVHAKDFSFDAPDSVGAGWVTFRMVNDGPDLHHMQIARLDSGKTVADFAAAMKNPGPPPKWVVFVGGPNAADPKLESNATLNLPEGNYVLLCFVDTPDHVPHMAKGMVRPLKVTASTTPGTEPAADVTVNMSDYAFAVQGPLTAGKHTFKVVNKGPQDHEIELVKFAPGKSAKDLVAWIAKFEGPPPGSALGGVAGVVKGGTGYFTADLTPGDYGLICFVPGPDGKVHAIHGMVKDFKVQ